MTTPLADAIDNYYAALERRLIDIATDQPREQFDLNNYTNDECARYFRFSLEEILEIMDVMELPAMFKFRNEETSSKHCFRVPREEAFCLCLHRLAYPTRYEDMHHVFYRSNSSISIIFNGVINHIYNKYAGLLEFTASQFTRERLEYFANAIRRKGGPYDNCIGFIDGTVRGIDRPAVNQQPPVNNDDKHEHALKYQAVMTPDGITSSLFESDAGAQHDGHLLIETGLLDIFDEYFNFEDGKKYVVYGDSAHRHHANLLAPHRVPLDDETSSEAVKNNKMKKLQIPFEWEFERTVSLFAFVDFHKKKRTVPLCSVAKQYVVATLLKNIKICLGGGQACRYFRITPPTLREYLAPSNIRSHPVSN